MSQQQLLKLYPFPEFKTCVQQQYSGKLDIKNKQGQTWTFFYQLGRIVWATGGTHPWRRWRRQMVQHCPKIELDKMRFRLEDTSIEYWDYRLLTRLLHRQELNREQIKVIVDDTIAEILFDVAQQSNFVSVNCDRIPELLLETPISFTSANLSLKQVENSWKIWLEAGLVNIFPDLAPKLCKPDRLQQQVSPSVYKNFIMLKGQYTIRDLAVKMNHNILSVARSLLPYIQKGIIELVEVSDLPLQITEVQNTANKRISPKAPLVACIDDSLQVCQILEEIITSNGLRFIKIQDPVQALATIIQHKPDLIFLDLVMPVINGYELCAQIRRISTFADTPVIIITGNDGLVDRVRARIVNATHFVTKPIVTDKIMDLVCKYLKVPSKHSAISTSFLAIAENCVNAL